MAETSTIFGFMKYVSATDILSDFKKTVLFYCGLPLLFPISTPSAGNRQTISSLTSTTSVENHHQKEYFFSIDIIPDFRG